MTKKTISKTLQIVAILTFTLPFFYTGCGTNTDKEKEKAIKDSLIADSLVKVANIKTTDTLFDKKTDSIKNCVSTINQNTTSQSHNDNYVYEKEKRLSDKIVNNFPILSWILVPSKDTYSGLGAVINLFPLTIFISVFISLLLLVIGLIIKFVDTKATKTFIILDFFILLGLLIARSPTWNSERLWGFWICVATTSVLLIYDIYILKTNKR